MAAIGGVKKMTKERRPGRLSASAYGAIPFQTSRAEDVFGFGGGSSCRLQLRAWSRVEQMFTELACGLAEAGRGQS